MSLLKNYKDTRPNLFAKIVGRLSSTISKATNPETSNHLLLSSTFSPQVACGSTAVYLVCLATLFATSQSLQMASNTWNPNDTGVNLFSSLSPPETDIFVPSGINVATKPSAKSHPFPLHPHVHSMFFGTRSLDYNKSNNPAAEVSPWQVYNNHKTCGFHGDWYFKDALLRTGSGVNMTPHHCTLCAKHVTGSAISDYPHRNTSPMINYSPESHARFAHFVWKNADNCSGLQFNPSTPDASQFNPSTPDARQFDPSIPLRARPFNPSTPPDAGLFNSSPLGGQFNPSTPPEARQYPSTLPKAGQFNPSIPPDSGQFNPSMILGAGQINSFTTYTCRWNLADLLPAYIMNCYLVCAYACTY